MQTILPPVSLSLRGKKKKKWSHRVAAKIKRNNISGILKHISGTY